MSALAGPKAAGRRPPWLLHRTLVVTVCLAAAWAAWQVYSSAAAEGKLDPAVARALRAHEIVSLRVELAFPPEEFHIRFLQDRGTVTGVQGRWVRMARVRPDAVWTIARQYWVRRLVADRGP